MSNTKTWRIYELDVWGNDAEGFDINDYWAIAKTTFTDEEINSDEAIIDRLIDMEILNPEYKGCYTIDGDSEWMLILWEETYEPILELRLINE